MKVKLQEVQRARGGKNIYLYECIDDGVSHMHMSCYNMYAVRLPVAAGTVTAP